MLIMDDYKKEYKLKCAEMKTKYCPFISRMGESGERLLSTCMMEQCIAFSGCIKRDEVTLPHCMRLQHKESNNIRV